MELCSNCLSPVDYNSEECDNCGYPLDEDIIESSSLKKAEDIYAEDDM